MTNEQIAKLARIAYENTVEAMNYCDGFRSVTKNTNQIMAEYQKELDFIEPFLALENDERKDVR